MADQQCSACRGTGWRLKHQNDVEVVERCACARTEHQHDLLRLARIPKRYEHCTFGTFQLARCGKSQSTARQVVEHFVKVYTAEMGKHCTRVDDDAMKLLTAHEWKGNVRELQNVIERAVIFAEGQTVGVSDIALVGSGAPPAVERGEDLQTAVKAYEREQIFHALTKYRWDKAATAKALGIGVSSLYRKIDELDIPNGKRGGKKS